MKKVHVNGKEIEFIPNSLKHPPEKFLIIKKSELVKFLESDQENSDNRFIIVAADYLGDKNIPKHLEEAIIVDNVEMSVGKFKIAALNIDATDD